MTSTPDETTTSERIRSIRDVLATYPVSFAILFGSAGEEALTSTSDVDVAVEFEGIKPEDNGYSDVFLRLYNALDDAVERDVDVVDFHSMSPRFARTVFDNGVVIVGSDDRRRELETSLAGELDSVEEAKNRISDSIRKMKASMNR